MNQKVTLVGAGLSGSLLAIFLAKRGFQVDVYERRPDMRKVNISAGKSINLALSTRGIYALQQVGLAEPVLSKAIPMRGRMMHAVTGELTYQPYGKNESEYINSISRKELNCLLMDEAEQYPGVRFYFNQRCTGMDFDKSLVFFANDLDGNVTRLEADTVIGTDGSASALRMDFLKTGHFNFSQTYENYGYKELHIPAALGGGFRLEQNALHIWPRGAYMMIALPNKEGDFTCTLFISYDKGDRHLKQLDTPHKVKAFFAEVFPDALPHMPGLEEDFFANPTGSLLTVKCYPWNVGGKALLMGDAAHAIVPFFGQGMNCCFEDVYSFDQLVAEYGADWEKVFTAFGQQRKENTDAIADMAVENFVEMRDLVTHKDFLLKKKAEVLLEEKFPGQFISKYAMVSFHRFPYKEAMLRGQIQDRILMEMCSKIDDVKDLNLENAFLKIQEQLKKEHAPLSQLY